MKLTKVCSNQKCKKPLKPITEFHLDNRSKDGRHSHCKDCRKENRRKK